MPITTTNEVLTSDGRNVEEILTELQNYIKSLENKTEVKY